MKRPVVLITGASRGIGKATALAFARAGWQVAITARTVSEGQTHAFQVPTHNGQQLPGSLATTLAELQGAGAEALAIPMDLLDLASVDAALDAVLARFGRIDALVNNAVYQSHRLNAPFLELDADEWARVLQGYVVAPHHLTKRALKVMLAQGHGVIVNVSSGAGESDPPLAACDGGWGVAYGAGKAAFSRMAGVIATEFGGQGIRAYTINPGVVATETLHATLGKNGELARKLGAKAPELPAAVILWLATSEAAASWQKCTIPVADFSLDGDTLHLPSGPARRSRPDKRESTVCTL
ncbi:SDR family oxidoreductase [Craterilacuibacter sp. RT1T]|uniref:SDR family NAD(P)-dependent oxidoreductase n=1 Tax=Craterilacuibacter sp. RT1T TaxID=2942211 RepID=UPI0020C17446|nr:SDR family oxidoreductase [Craterilacuibacter sp. RT1T]MCL6262976.1 SDR family oxidoreductase [Craterilacuibacter sp. RT1T]